MDEGAPRIIVLFPVACFLHVLEEWYGGFVAWTYEVIGRGVGTDRFIGINACALVVIVLVTAAARRHQRLAWLAVSLAGLIGLNGAVHALATLGTGRYSPGTVTGVLLYIPLSVVVLRATAKRLTTAGLTAAIGLGAVVHGIVVLIAFL